MKICAKKYCKDNKIEYVTENEAIIDYLKNLNLYEYIGRHDPKKNVVMGDSAYDDKRIENTIKDKKWSFVMSLKKKRSVKGPIRNNLDFYFCMGASNR